MMQTQLLSGAYVRCCHLHGNSRHSEQRKDLHSLQKGLGTA